VAAVARNPWLGGDIRQLAVAGLLFEYVDLASSGKEVFVHMSRLD
jgi:hypothetical protein